MFTPAPLRAGSLAAMTDTPPPIPPDLPPLPLDDMPPSLASWWPTLVEPDDAGAAGHEVPAELLELHGLLELANNGGPA